MVEKSILLGAERAEQRLAGLEFGAARPAFARHPDVALPGRHGLGSRGLCCAVLCCAVGPYRRTTSREDANDVRSARGRWTARP